jgi:hypothetical protein
VQFFNNYAQNLASDDLELGAILLKKVLLSKFKFTSQEVHSLVNTITRKIINTDSADEKQ